jgi:FkbM family methyltransferase
MNMSTAAQDVVTVTFAGKELYYQTPDADDHIQRVLRDGRVYEEGLLLDCFARKLRPGAIIDVGANIGNHTVVFAKVLKRKVIAFEPYATAFEALQHNVKLNGVEALVTLIPAAAGRKRGRADLQAPPTGNWGRSSISEASDGAIDVIPLDALKVNDRVAVLKIDVEGMENAVLTGARRIIRRNRPLIYVEVQDETKLAVVKKRLGRLGYRVLRRFNQTPTYLFAHCPSLRDELAALLDKTDALFRLDDLAAFQRDLLRSLPTAAAERRANSAAAVDAPADVLSAVRATRQALAEQLAAGLEECASLRKETQELTEQIRQALGEMPDRVSGAVSAVLENWTAPPIGDAGIAATRRRPRSRPDAGVAIPVVIGQARVKVRLPLTRSQENADGSVLATDPRSIPDRLADQTQHVARLSGTAADSDSASGAVSVIMTTFNSQEFVEDAVRNILAQSHRELELIIVDDASTDGTWTVLANLAREDSRVQPVKMFTNRGTYWCKNYGLTRARGRYVTFQDSDDCSDADRLRLQVKELQTTGAVVCTCNYVRVDAGGAVVPNRGVTQRKAIMAVMFDRQEVLQHAGYFDSVRTSADDEFTRRLGIVFGQDRICHIDKPLYMAALRDGSLTNDRCNRAEICVDDSPSDQSFLSAPRREYVRQYCGWHERLKARLESPYMPFPLPRRRFPAPSLILPEPGQRDNFVTVSLASMPSREALLKQTVESILPQADALNVYLNGYSATPSWLGGDNIQVIHSSEYGDLRDNGKFFFLDALLPGYHFTIDDDIVYPADYVQKLILKIEQYDRRAIVGVHGVIFPSPLVHFMKDREVLHFKRALGRDRLVNLLGTGTTAYHVDALELSLDDFQAPGMADLWLALTAKRQNVPMIAIERPERWLSPLDEADESSLYRAAMKDCQLQTDVARAEEPWGLEETHVRYPLLQNLLSRFSVEEIQSSALDLEPLLQSAMSN